ncbi:hypothetical protein A4A49_06335 [Nicotiana attenuata]|uniref:Uncharacterized protein n=1 Tax=Nicotiana attenuata TaxID=49451 RepID=A0A1J6II93_NICAT|nr:hypothetical protein A4A49_06335 [Nicotiana attenuata]
MFLISRVLLGVLDTELLERTGLFQFVSSVGGDWAIQSSKLFVCEMNVDHPSHEFKDVIMGFWPPTCSTPIQICTDSHGILYIFTSSCSFSSLLPQRNKDYKGYTAPDKFRPRESRDQRVRF